MYQPHPVGAVMPPDNRDDTSACKTPCTTAQNRARSERAAHVDLCSESRGTRRVKPRVFMPGDAQGGNRSEFAIVSALRGSGEPSRLEGWKQEAASIHPGSSCHGATVSNPGGPDVGVLWHACVLMAGPRLSVQVTWNGLGGGCRGGAVPHP